jgi:PTH1 family peptidyl-tRNA hydrolase
VAEETWESKSVVLGLGNPGAEYEGSRHNRGREVVEELARRRGLTLVLGDCQTRLASRGELVLATPETFMNRSGYAARCLVERFGVDPARMLVVYDDIYLPLGALRLRTRGGAAGQKGIASILECLRTDAIARLSLGIAPHPTGQPDQPAERDGVDTLNRPDFVLARFTLDEEAAAREQILRAADACEVWLTLGAAEAMNRFNRDPEPTP